jgi:dolichyl-phosphate-mannose-protein mannosyltransferase
MSMRTWLTSLFLGLGSLAFFLAGISKPPSVYFDEKLYVDAANAVVTGAPDPSPYGPPLGKLMIAASIAISGNNSFGWRWPSAVCGALTAVAVFLFLLLLLDDYTLALTGAGLMLLNNFVFVFSRTAMMDIFLVAFAMWGLLAFVAALKVDQLETSTRRAVTAFSGIMFGCSMACKWNGVDQLAVVLVLGVILFWWSKRLGDSDLARCRENLQQAGWVWLAISFLVLPAVTYLATFWPLFRSQRIPFTLATLVSANAFIWQFHRAVVGNTGLIVPWYKWPFMTQPTRALSYLVGNWFVMWAGILALLYCLRRFARSLPETLIVSLYVVNMLQWIVTPQPCVFYYYYFPAAMFVGMAIPAALHRLPARYFGVRLSVASLLPAFCIFAYCFAHMAHLGAPFDIMLGYWP